jgi:hypothetical protein
LDIFEMVAINSELHHKLLTSQISIKYVWKS